jgi:predicted SprT family Zn-dependent metalloprotease
MGLTVVSGLPDIALDPQWQHTPGLELPEELQARARALPDGIAQAPEPVVPAQMDDITPDEKLPSPQIEPMPPNEIDPSDIEKEISKVIEEKEKEKTIEDETPDEKRARREKNFLEDLAPLPTEETPEEKEIRQNAEKEVTKVLTKLGAKNTFNGPIVCRSNRDMHERVDKAIYAHFGKHLKPYNPVKGTATIAIGDKYPPFIVIDTDGIAQVMREKKIGSRTGYRFYERKLKRGEWQPGVSPTVDFTLEQDIAHTLCHELAHLIVGNERGHNEIHDAMTQVLFAEVCPESLDWKEVTDSLKDQRRGVYTTRFQGYHPHEKVTRKNLSEVIAMLSEKIKGWGL